MSLAIKSAGLLAVSLAALLLIYLRLVPALPVAMDSSVLMHTGLIQDHGTASLFEVPINDKDGGTLLARDLVRNSPLNATALVWLASNYQGGGMARKALAESIAQQGWRDPQSQRFLYNLTFSEKNYKVAIRHADALLRQNSAERELYRHFNSELPDPAFRKALADTIADGTPWSEDYLKRALADAPTGDLRNFLADILQSQGRSPADSQLARREITSRFFLAFRQRGAQDAAAEVARAQMLRGNALPGFDKQREGARIEPARWSLSRGYKSRGTGVKSELTASSSVGTYPVGIFLALKPGQYVLGSANQRDLPLAEWVWRMDCDGGKRLRGEFEVSQTVSVPTGCPLVHLQLRAVADNPPPLPALRLVPMS